MSSLFSFLSFLLVSTALAMAAYKWTGVNPHRVEDSPTWLGAIWSGFQVSLVLLLAFALIDGAHTKFASFLYYYACGSVVAPAFWTSFAPSPEEEPNFVMRWWKGKLNAIGDGMAKSLFTVPLAMVIGLFIGNSAAFWVTIIFATLLSVGKIGVTLSLIEADADQALVRKRRRALVMGNVIATGAIGITAMICWAWLAHMNADQFPPIRFDDYVTILGLLAGILFHTL